MIVPTAKTGVVTQDQVGIRRSPAPFKLLTPGPPITPLRYQHCHQL